MGDSVSSQSQNLILMPLTTTSYHNVKSSNLGLLHYNSYTPISLGNSVYSFNKILGGVVEFDGAIFSTDSIGRTCNSYLMIKNQPAYIYYECNIPSPVFPFSDGVSLSGTLYGIPTTYTYPSSTEAMPLSANLASVGAPTLIWSIAKNLDIYSLYSTQSDFVPDKLTKIVVGGINQDFSFTASPNATAVISSQICIDLFSAPPQGTNGVNDGNDWKMSNTDIDNFLGRLSFSKNVLNVDLSTISEYNVYELNIRNGYLLTNPVSKIIYGVPFTIDSLSYAILPTDAIQLYFSSQKA